MFNRYHFAFGSLVLLACSGDPHVVGVANGTGGATSSNPVGGSSSLSTSGTGGSFSSGGSLGLGGAESQTGGSSTAATGGANCACLLGAYVPVCGTNGTTYDARCGDSCVPVAIECRHSCPCTLTGGASSVGGSGASVATGGNSSGGSSSTSTVGGGLCGSNCSVNTTMVSLCGASQVLLLCQAPSPGNLSIIMSANSCTDAGIDATGYCCPTLIQTACKSLTI